MPFNQLVLILRTYCSSYAASGIATICLIHGSAIMICLFAALVFYWERGEYLSKLTRRIPVRGPSVGAKPEGVKRFMGSDFSVSFYLLFVNLF
jgi:hypothetical protein